MGILHLSSHVALCPCDEVVLPSRGVTYAQETWRVCKGCEEGSSGAKTQHATKQTTQRCGHVSYLGRHARRVNASSCCGFLSEQYRWLQVVLFSVPSRLVKIAESDSGRLLGAFTELHVQPSASGVLQTEIDDGSGAHPVIDRPPAPASNLTFVRVMHAAPYRQHLVRKTAQYEDMLVTLHKDLFTKTIPAMGEEHNVTALPSGVNPAFGSLLSMSTLQCSPQDILVWSRGDARFYLRGSEGQLNEDHILAVTALVRAGAWRNSRSTLEELKEEPFPGLMPLYQNGKVELLQDTSLYRSWPLQPTCF